MPRRREAAMQQIGQLLPMTQEQDVRTAQTPPCANGPNGSAKQDATAPPCKPQTPADDQGHALSGEMLETLRRECLERSVVTRVARLPCVIDKAVVPATKLDSYFSKGEESRAVLSHASKAEKSRVRSPSRAHNQHHSQRHHHQQEQRVKLPATAKLESRRRSSTELERRHSRSPAVSPQKSKTEPPSPPPLQSAVQSLQQQQQQRSRTRLESESRPSGQAMVCKKEEIVERSGVAKCNYVLSDNYENLSGDESPASRSLEASNVDQKAIELFLPLVDAVEEHQQNEVCAPAAEEASENVASDDYDDLPEEGSLVIDDGGVDGELNAPGSASAASSAGSGHKWPLRSSSSMRPDSSAESSESSPTTRGDLTTASRGQSLDSGSDSGSRWLSLKDQKNKKSKMALLRKTASTGSPMRSDDVGTTPPPLAPAGCGSPPGRKQGKRLTPRPAMAPSSRSGSCEQEDRVGARAGSGVRTSGEEQSDGASASQQRNGLRKRSRWKTTASQEDDDAGGADSCSTVDYQLSSDEEGSKGIGPSDEQTAPAPPPPPPPQTSHLGGASGKKQRKNSEDHHRRSGGEQHGDESRYKRLAQELPGFNWLEQKIMGHSGANFTDAPPMSKHVAREAPAATAPAPEKTEQKTAASTPEPKHVYAPDTDILRRSMSMSEIQDDCCEEDGVDETPVLEATVMAAPEVEKIEGDEPSPGMVQSEMPRQILVTALPDTYHTDPRISQVITTTALMRQQYPLEVNMANPNTMLELPMGAPGLTSAPPLTGVPQNMPGVETEPRPSSKSQIETISQGRTAPEDQSSDSDVLYLGVSRKSLSPSPEQRGGENRTSLLSEAAKAPEAARPLDGNIGHTTVSGKPRSSGSEPINLSDAARRGEPYGASPREQYSFFQPHAFVMADHQRWLEERRYHEMMNARGPLMQPRQLPAPPQTPLELSQRRLSGGTQMMPNRLEAQQQYRAALANERPSALRQAPPAQQGPSPHQAPAPHQPSPSHQSPLSQQTLHQAQLAQQGAPSHQPPPSHQAQFSHQVAQSHQPPPSHQAQMLHQAQMSHQMPLSRQTHQLHQTPQFYPMPRAHQTQPSTQPFQPLPALTHDSSPRNGRPDVYPAQQRYKTMDQAYGMSPHAQQMGVYGSPQTAKRSPEPAAKTGPPLPGSVYTKDGKADTLYKDATVSRLERPGQTPLQQAPLNAKPPSSSPLGQHPEPTANSSQASSLKTEMEMLKDELKYLDALAAQKEAEYEKVVHTRQEKLKTLTQLEARYKRSVEPSQSYPKDDLRYPTGMEVRQSPIAQSDKSSPLQDDVKAAPRQRSGSSGGSVQQKPSPPSLSSSLSKTSPAQQPVPGLIPYPLSHPQQTRQPLPLPPHANMPLNMPLIGAGMFNLRNMELQRDFGPMMAQPHSSPMVPPGYGRPYYPLERTKHPTLNPMEAPKPSVKRKYSPANAGLPQANGDMRPSSQRAAMTPAGHRQREPEKVTAPLSQEHRQWLQAMKSRETAGEPPGYPASVQSAFQTYNFYPNRRMLPEDMPLNPAMTNAAWSNYAEGLHEQYALHMAKQSMYPSHPAWSGLEKQQRSGETAGAGYPSREPPAKRLSRDEPVMQQMAKDRLAMRPVDKPAALAAPLGSQAPPHEQALPSQPAQPSQNALSKNNTCVICGQHAQYMCSGCQNVWYCGPNCQRSHWVNHSNVCMGTKR